MGGGADVFWKEFPVATEFAYLPLQLEDMFCMCGEGKGLFRDTGIFDGALIEY